MESDTTQHQQALDYSKLRPLGFRRWPWIAGVVLALTAIGMGIVYLVVPAYSIHKARELNIQAAILAATPSTPNLVHEWNPAAASGEQPWRNWTAGPNAYDSVDAKATVYPILRAGMTGGTDRWAVLVWLDAERADGFDVEYAVIQLGSRFSRSRIVNSGTAAFSGGRSEQQIRVWSATFPEGDRSRFVFDFEIGGVRQSAKGTLAASKLSFEIRAAPNLQ